MLNHQQMLRDLNDAAAELRKVTDAITGAADQLIAFNAITVKAKRQVQDAHEAATLLQGKLKALRAGLTPKSGPS